MDGHAGHAGNLLTLELLVGLDGEVAVEPAVGVEGVVVGGVGQGSGEFGGGHPREVVTLAVNELDPETRPVQGLERLGRDGAERDLPVPLLGLSEVPGGLPAAALLSLELVEMAAVGSEDGNGKTEALVGDDPGVAKGHNVVLVIRRGGQALSPLGCGFGLFLVAGGQGNLGLDALPKVVVPTEPEHPGLDNAGGGALGFVVSGSGLGNPRVDVKDGGGVGQDVVEIQVGLASGTFREALKVRSDMGEGEPVRAIGRNPFRGGPAEKVLQAG